jgi:hypothetical protein
MPRIMIPSGGKQNPWGRQTQEVNHTEPKVNICGVGQTTPLKLTRKQNAKGKGDNMGKAENMGVIGKGREKT